ncbi:MAG: glucosaminidase domain-containing protein [Candidatus Levybacteria bacterium]|nr:glucosaminidase domain-containing protein [Candidatus Levybacteria bacterium]
MKKFQAIVSFVLVILMLSKVSGDSYAFEQASGSSATLNPTITQKPVDNRTEILEGFLESYGSPLAPYAADFVESADKYSLDWRLVASIAGLESTFGKNIPYNSYNGWGWGVYGNNVIRFASWSEGIETISKGLRQNYLGENPDSNPYLIGHRYAASPTWAQRVTFFMNRIEAYRLRNGKSTLALAL